MTAGLAARSANRRLINRRAQPFDRCLFGLGTKEEEVVSEP
jgi:hypothetical protein